MNKYFFTFLLLTTFSVSCMDENKENDEDTAFERATHFKLHGTEQLSKKAWEWLKEQDIVTTMNIIQSKLEKTVDFQLAVIPEEKESDTQVFNVFCEMGGLISNCRHKAYTIKQLFDAEEEPNLTIYKIQSAAEFCIKLCKINQKLKKHIKKQKIEGTSLITEFNEGNKLHPSYIAQLFRNVFPTTYVGYKNQEK